MKRESQRRCFEDESERKILKRKAEIKMGTVC
jgi:hypothetical protein